MSKQKSRSPRNGIKTYTAPCNTSPVIEEDFEEDELDEAAFRVLGRVTRAITYSVLSHNVPDMTLRELYAFASLPQAELLHDAYGDHDGKPLKIHDTADVFLMTPGVAQGFFHYPEILETFESLEKRGLVSLERLDIAPHRAEMLGRDYSVRVSLTQAGVRIAHSMCCNLNKAAPMFDEQVVREGLDSINLPEK